MNEWEARVAVVTWFCFNFAKEKKKRICQNQKQKKCNSRNSNKTCLGSSFSVELEKLKLLSVICRTSRAKAAKFKQKLFSGEKNRITRNNFAKLILCSEKVKSCRARRSCRCCRCCCFCCCCCRCRCCCRRSCCCCRRCCCRCRCCCFCCCCTWRQLEPE